MGKTASNISNKGNGGDKIPSRNVAATPKVVNGPADAEADSDVDEFYDELNNSISDHVNRLRAREARVRNMSGTIDGFHTTIHGLNTHANGLKTNISNLRNEVARLNTEVQTRDERLNTALEDYNHAAASCELLRQERRRLQNAQGGQPYLKFKRTCTLELRNLRSSFDEQLLAFENRLLEADPTYGTIPGIDEPAVNVINVEDEDVEGWNGVIQVVSRFNCRCLPI